MKNVLNLTQSLRQYNSSASSKPFSKSPSSKDLCTGLLKAGSVKGQTEAHMRPDLSGGRFLTLIFTSIML